MTSLRRLIPCLVLLAACDSKTKEQLQTLAHSDSLRTDSLVSIKNDLLTEVMASTQFMNDLNTQMAKLRSKSTTKLATSTGNESEVANVKEQRAAVVASIHDLVTRLDASESRLASLRARAKSLSAHDSGLVAQVAMYEKTIGDLRQAVEQQKAEYQSIIDKQNAQISTLTLRVDTVTKDNVRLSGERAALTDTVGQLTSEKNTAYYVIGSKDELVKSGILVEEGHKRFLLLGGRPVAPARDLDPSKFTKIDRLRDRTISFPDGQYTILSRQNPAFASPVSAEGNKIAGGLKIEQPERFWAPSRFLIIVKS
jgi:hypothetical protein